MTIYMKKILFPSLAAFALVVASCTFNGGSANTGSDIVSTIAEVVKQMSSETESQAQVDGKMELPAVKGSDIICSYTGYVASYNTTTLIPDWVAYELLPEELEGDAERSSHMFSMDTSRKMRQAKREDYRDSGWSKGHMAPAADFRWDDDVMGESFYFMNCCPQNEELNAGDWEFLERKVRSWAREYGKVWVVTGPIVGTGKYGAIGERNVVVPDAFFKAVMVQQGGKYRSIAFTMTNDASRQYLRDCALTVNELEKITGIDFFPLLDDAVEDSVEGQLDLKGWGIKTR